MNQKFIQKTLLSSLIVGLLTLHNANAMGFQKNINKDGSVNHNGLTVSDVAFYKMLNNTETNKISLKFGIPDAITTLKNTNGNQEGVVWTYKNAVKKDTENLDANFIFIAGEFKYVTLSNNQVSAGLNIKQ